MRRENSWDPLFAVLSKAFMFVKPLGRMLGRLIISAFIQLGEKGELGGVY
jgi:hypothetical protein